MEWYFDHDIAATGTPEPQLEVQDELGDWFQPTATARLAVGHVHCEYAGTVITAGGGWRITDLPTQVTATPPIAVPQSGTLGSV